jgi:hypothetical protein
MTTETLFLDVTEGIANLSIPGVAVLDVDRVTTSKVMSPGSLCPIPDNFVSNIVYTPDSFGVGTSRKGTLAYTLNYRYYHSAIGAELSGVYPVMLERLKAILNKVLSTESIADSDGDAIAVSFDLAGIGKIGPVYDPAGNTFHGVDISFRIQEFIN